MRKFFKFASALLLAGIAAVSCGKNVEKPLDISGEWHLVRVESRAATVGDQTVDVYVSFDKGGSFELFQMLGAGRYRKFNGTWTLSGNVLTGRYSTGASLASSYTVNQVGDVLELVSADGLECDTYCRTTIPPDIRESAIY